MIERIRFFINRIREQLWIRPLIMCLVSVGAVFLAKATDYLDAKIFIPEVSLDTTETLLKILGGSMLVIATFAVGSMVSSYSSASGTATPRSFPLVISDDVSQNALSGFIGAFIFCVVALVALKTELYEKTGHFVLFCGTLVVFAAVILIFLRWVDCIARLGRLGTTVDKVEGAAAEAMKKRKRAPTLRGVATGRITGEKINIYADQVGYVQRIDVEKLQFLAEEAGVLIEVVALPGAFTVPSQPLAYFSMGASGSQDVEMGQFAKAFVIADNRTFQDDPRFGLIVLAEIAGRALSPAVNDPGTAIDIIGTFVRLFVLWNSAVSEDEKLDCNFDRVSVPEIATNDMFDDAFTAIARDGADAVEVAVRLQKALRALADLGNPTIAEAAIRHARMAQTRALSSLDLPEDIAAVKAAGIFKNLNSEE